MSSFWLFALSILKGTSSPALVTNKRLEVISANEMGWALLGSVPGYPRGRVLDDLIRLVATRVRTPVSSLVSYDPVQGWRAIVESPIHRYPRLAIAPVDGRPLKVVELDIIKFPGEEAIEVARMVYANHPEWVVDSIAFEDLVKMITPENYVFSFYDVAEEALVEEQRQEIMRKTLEVVVRTLNHYIRNALTPIRGYSQLIRDRGENLPRETQIQIMDKMITSVQTITSLLDALRGIRDVHFEEPLGANATLLKIEQGLKLQLGEYVEGDEVG